MIFRKIKDLNQSCLLYIVQASIDKIQILEKNNFIAFVICNYFVGNINYFADSRFSHKPNKILVHIILFKKSLVNI